jgi:hypothetical protein
MKGIRIYIILIFMGLLAGSMLGCKSRKTTTPETLATPTLPDAQDSSDSNALLDAPGQDQMPQLQPPPERIPPVPPELPPPPEEQPREQMQVFPAMPIMDLFAAYNYEFAEPFWLMLRFPPGLGIGYGGSLFIDDKGGINPVYNHPAGRIDIEQGVQDTNVVAIYFSYQSREGPFTGTRGSLRFFRVDLTSEQVYDYYTKRRNSVSGFEVTPTEIKRSDIP